MGVKNIIGELQVNGSKVITEDTLPDIPNTLSDLTDDTTHRTVSDIEKATWNDKSDFSGSYNDLTDKPTIPAAVTVDSALSSASTNPVQNKVINTVLGNKVDKVGGKGLSTNDYTTEDKNKLDYLYGNYSEGLTYTLSDDGTYYIIKSLGSCTDTDIKIPPLYNGLPVTSIGDDAFQSRSRLTSVVIGDSVTSIGGHAFQFCDSLTSVVIGNSVTSIGDYAFYGCSSLTSITIPDSVTSISDFVFSNCDSLTNVVIGNSITSISSSAFSGCSSLTSVVIPNSVTTIDKNAFHNCSSLISVEIGDSVTSIGQGAFWSCSNLTRVVIPNSVTSIGQYAF